MATVKNFGLAGVAANVQFSKGGGKIDWDGSKFNLTDASGTQVDLLVPLVPTVDADAASKQYVDSVATGLDVKNSVRLATTAALAGTYTAGVSEGQGTWTALGASLLIDGVTVANGDRILVKDDTGTDQEGHGIWVVSGVGSAITFARSTDADNTPNNEVSGGMFTFVEEGSQADTGWVMSSPNGVAVVDTASADNLIFSQFSGSASFTGGDGIDITASVISHDTSGTADTTIALADVITFFDAGPSGQLQRASWTNILTDLDILTDAAGGNALTASQGITLTGNNLTLTLPGLTDGAEVLALADSLAVFDGTSTLEYTFTDVVDDLNIPHGVASTGLVVRTEVDDGGDDYSTVDIVESTTARQEGAQVNNGGGTAGDIEIGVDIDNLTDNGTNMVAADQFIVDNGTNNRSITGTEIADGVSTLLSLDSTRIDAGDTFTFVDTNATTDSVTIGVEAFGAASSLAIAEFKHGLVDDACGFIFTNGTNEVRIEATGETNCDIRLVPAGTGAVLIGDAGAALIQGDDGTNLTVKGGNATTPTDAGDLILEGGDGSTSLSDGDVLIRPGNGATASTGKVCIQDEDEENIACFFGTTGEDVNSFVFTSAITGSPVLLSVTGDANLDLSISSAGTGRISLDGNEFPTSTSAVKSIFAIQNADGAGDVSAVTAAGGADRVLQYDDADGAIKWVLQSSVGGQSFQNWVTDSGTIVADSTADTATLAGGVGIDTAGDPSTDTITLTLDLTELGNPGAITAADEIVWIQGNAGPGDKRTFTQFLEDLDIVTAAADGILVRTSADTYASRTIDASVTATEEGIIVTDGAGESGDPQIGLDIQGLTPDSSVVGTDQLVVFNGTNNVKVLVSDLVSGGTLAFRTIDADTGTDPVADSSADTLILAGGTGIATVGESGADSVTFNLDFDTNLSPVAEDLAATDELAFFNASGSAGNVGTISGQRIADGVSTLLSLDNTRITDSDDTFVDTDAVVGAVTINTDDAGGATTQLLATFKAASGSVVTDANFLFQNEDAVDTGGNDELQIVAAGGATDIDIRLAPKGAGEVILGDAAANATLTASDGTAGFNLTLSAGDGSAGDGGDVIITPGNGTGADGKVCITDDDSVNVTCFEGVDTAVNNFVMTNAVTAKGPILEVEGSDTNIDMEFLPKGTGVLAIDTDVISATTYRDNLTDDSNDIPNTAYVAEQVAATLSGGISSFKFTVNLGVDGDTDPASSAVPASATVLRVTINVTTLNTTSTLTIGTTGSPGTYADATTNDPSATGLYNVDLMSTTVGDLRAVVASQTGAVGSADVVVEYKND